MKINGKQVVGYKNKTEFFKKTFGYEPKHRIQTCYDLNHVGGFCGNK